MYELEISIDGIRVDSFEAESIQRLTSEVARRFRSIDPLDEPLPFEAGVDDNGRIVKMVLDADLDSPWWQKHHLLVNGRASRFIAVIRKINRGNQVEGFALPSELNQGRGKAWAAVSNGKVIDIVYMNPIPDGMSFNDFRLATRSKLSKKGNLITGLIDGCRLIPKIGQKS